jgi:DNA-binding XRE family transcriptional regulator
MSNVNYFIQFVCFFTQYVYNVIGGVILQIGSKIRELRKSKNLTQKELGNKVGLSEQAISQYERDERQPNIEILSKIAASLGTNIDKLIANNKLNLYDNEQSHTSIYMAENTLECAISDLKQLRIKNKIGLKKMANLLSIDYTLLKNIEDKNIANAEITVNYTTIINDLIDLRKSLISSLIDYGIFNDYNKIDLSDLLKLNKNQYSMFISRIQRYIKFVLDEIKEN